MNRDRWHRLKTLFAAAIDLRTEERARFIERSAEGDAELEDLLLELLANHEEACDFLDSPYLDPRSLIPELQSTPARAGAGDRHRPPLGATAVGTSSVPRKVGQYRLVREIGGGGMGVVYCAFDEDRGNHVALKTLRAGSLRRFKNEFRSLANLNHPNLVTLYELVVDADGFPPFLTMELIYGQDFVSYVRTARTGLSESVDRDRLVDATTQLCHGVMALHRASTLHRDLKPSNVLVDREGRVVLVDFGLAAALGPDGSHLSNTSNIVGTPLYMPPEQAVGGPLSTASDWYGVGVMLYEALVGEPPFHGSPYEMTGDKLDMNFEAPDVGMPDLEALCEGLLQADPALRLDGTTVLERLPRKNPALVVSRDMEIRKREGAVDFVGRSPQLEVLRQKFAAIRGGRPATVLLSGPSGIGKTALANHFLSDIKDSNPADLVLLRGRCFEQESVPFKAIDGVVDELADYLQSIDPAEAAIFLPRELSSLAQMFPVLQEVRTLNHAIRRGTPAVDRREVRTRAFRALRELLGRLGHYRRLVLFIDDLQWGDVDSARLLADLMQEPDPPAAMLVCCYRSEDVEASPMLRSTLLAVRAGDWGGDIVELKVEALSFEEATVLAQSLLERSGSGTDESARGVARESAGIPFFIRELVRSAPEDEVRPTLDDAIRSRVSKLPDQARRLLELVAIAGQPVALSVINAAATLGSLSIQEALTLLRANQLIKTRGDAAVETYHDRIRETIISSLRNRPEIIKTYYLDLAHSLESLGEGAPQTLAAYFEAAAIEDKAAAYASMAADAAFDALAFDRAAELYARSLNLYPHSSDRAVELKSKFAEALAKGGRGLEAADAYLRAAHAASVTDSIRLKRLAAHHYLCTGYVDDGLAVIRDVMRACGVRVFDSNVAVLISFLAHQLWTRFRGLKFRERSSREIPPNELIRIDSCWSASCGLGMVDTLRGAEFQARGLLLALRSGDAYRIALALQWAAVYSAMGGLGNARRTARLKDAAKDISRSLGDPYASAIHELSSAMVAWCEGRFREGRDFAMKSEQLLRDHCTGVEWELQGANIFMLHSMYWLGEIQDLIERLPGLMKGCRDRGDLFAETVMHVRLEHSVLLALDEPNRIRESLAAAMEPWSKEGFHAQHLYETFATVETALYSEPGPSAWIHLQSRWDQIKRSLFMQVQELYVEAWHLRARAALSSAVLETSARRRKSLLREAARAQRRIRRVRAPYADALSNLLLAGLETAKSDASAAVLRLEAAETACTGAELGLYGAAARLLRGQLQSKRGSALVDDATSWMSSRGVRDPLRFANMLVPGAWS